MPCQHLSPHESGSPWLAGAIPTKQGKFSPLGMAKPHISTPHTLSVALSCPTVCIARDVAGVTYTRVVRNGMIHDMRNRTS